MTKFASLTWVHCYPISSPLVSCLNNVHYSRLPPLFNLGSYIAFSDVSLVPFNLEQPLSFVFHDTDIFEGYR